MATAEKANSGRSRRRRPKRCSANRRAPGSHERDRVDRALVDPHLEVEVAARGGARAADGGDDLPGVDVLSRPDERAAGADVRVPGADAVAVADLDPVAVGPEGAGVDDGSRGRRTDVGAAAGGDVGAAVVGVGTRGLAGARAEGAGDRPEGGLGPALGA